MSTRDNKINKRLYEVKINMQMEQSVEGNSSWQIILKQSEYPFWNYSTPHTISY